MSKKKECPNCATEISEQTKICHICGYEFPQKEGKSKFFWLIAIILLILFLFPLIKILLGLLK
jgi:hypothetical protein